MSQRHIELVACLHNARLGQALIYVRAGDRFYRLNKVAKNPLNYLSLGSRDACVTDARTITRYAPGYLYYDAINNAPLSQLQLERMVMTMQAMGHLSDEQQAQA
jgi:hypothetical protein